MNYAERQAAGLCPYGNLADRFNPAFQRVPNICGNIANICAGTTRSRMGLAVSTCDLVGKGSVRGIKAGNTADPLRERTHRSTAAFMEVLRFYPGRKPYKAKKKIIAEVVRRHPEWEHRVESVRILADQLPILLGEFDSVVFEFTGVRPNETN